MACLLLVLFCTGGHAGAQSTAIPAKSGRILVKLRTALGNSVEQSLPLETLSLRSGEGSSEVQTFMGRYRARAVRPLYPELVREKKQRGVSDLQLALEVRQRFASRASRFRRTFNPPEISRTYVLEVGS